MAGGAPGQGQQGQSQGQPQISSQTISDIQGLLQRYQSGGFGGGGFGGGAGGGGMGGGFGGGQQGFQPQGQQGFQPAQNYAQPAFGAQNQQQGPMAPPNVARAGSGGAGYSLSGGPPGTGGNFPVTPLDWQQGQQAPQFSPQGPMGGYPTMPQGGGPDVTGSGQGGGFAFDGSGSDAGVGGKPTQGIQSPFGSSNRRPEWGGQGGERAYAGKGGAGYSLSGGPPGTGGNFPVTPVGGQGFPQTDTKPLSLAQLRPQTDGLQVQGNPTASPFVRGRGRMATRG